MARSDCLPGALLAAGGESVLVFARHIMVGGDVVGGFGHGIHAELRLHFGVHKAPANGGVSPKANAKTSALLTVKNPMLISNVVFAGATNQHHNANFGHLESADASPFRNTGTSEPANVLADSQ